MLTLEDRLQTLEDCYNRMLKKGIVKNKTEFADFVNINRTTLSSAFGGNERYLTGALVARVVAKCSDELTDEPTQTQTKETILVIPTSARAGTLGDFAESVQVNDCERMVSPIKGADYAIQVTGDSMTPEYPNGSIAIIKKVNHEMFLEWGKVYVVDTFNGAVIKQLLPHGTDEIECRSLNPSYPPFNIKRTDILGCYRVMMVCALK